MMKFSIVLLMIVGIPYIGVSDSVGVMNPYVTVSSSKKQIFCMAPPLYQIKEGKNKKVHNGLGIAYSLGENGLLQKIWQVEGWYNSEIFLSKNGRFLTRVEFSHPGYYIKKTDIAIYFYDKGEILKKYCVSDLINDNFYIDTSTTGYSWVNYHNAPQLNDDNQFSISTKEGYRFSFNVVNGEMVKKIKEMGEPVPDEKRDDPVPEGQRDG